MKSVEGLGFGVYLELMVRVSGFRGQSCRSWAFNE